jgi:phenol 2-monooxygenase
MGEFLYSTHDSLIPKFTKSEEDIDSFIETIVILSGDRKTTQQEQIPSCFMPVCGKFRMRGMQFLSFQLYINGSSSPRIIANTSQDIHKIYIDDESYNYGHGHAYEFYGIDPDKGAIIIVRPDHRTYLPASPKLYFIDNW